MIALRRIDDAERRTRLAVRHHLGRPAASVEGVARDLAGLHSSDPATPFLSAWARVQRFTVGTLEDALYERRTLVRMLGMRRTIFVVPRDLAAVMDAACTKALAPPERRRLVAMLEEQQIARHGASWIKDVERRVLEALATRGEASASELRKDVPELGEKLHFGEGKRWAGSVGVSTRVLFLLATDARIVRGRPRGTWLSTQYRWARTGSWLGEPLEAIAPAEARAQLARRWLRACGPGTLADLRWWTGWTARHTKEALAAADAVEVELDTGAGYVLSDDLEAPRAREGWVALLPALDPTTMAWKERNFYLGALGPRLFDRNGNAGPTIWADGRVVGGWAHRPDGRIAVEVLDDVGAAARAGIDEQAAQLESWLGDVRIIPRFRTPLEQSLTR